MNKRMINNFNKMGRFKDDDLIKFHFQQNFTERFNYVLKDKGTKLSELEKDMRDLPDNTECKFTIGLSKFKNGKLYPSFKVLDMIARALEVTIYDLGYPRGIFQATTEFAEWFNTHANDDTPENDDLLEYEPDEFDNMDEECYFNREIIKRLQGVSIDRYIAISLFTTTYLSIEDDCIELILRFQKLNDEEKQHLINCMSILSETQSLEANTDKSSSAYKQILEFMKNYNSSNGEKYTITEAENSIWEFVKKNNRANYYKLLEYINFYTSLDTNCFELLINFLDLDKDIKRDMILQIADQMVITPEQ